MRRRSFIRTPKFDWLPISPVIETHIHEVLESWVGTPYMDGQNVKGVGCDCVRFVTGAIDELFGRELIPIPKLPSDACLHDREASMRVMRIILEKYQPLEDVLEEGTLEPGDIIVNGPPTGGPGHAMFAGVQPNTLYQATRQGVFRCGMQLSIQYSKIFAVYRCTVKETWVSPTC
jgi:hypothetical protein